MVIPRVDYPQFRRLTGNGSRSILEALFSPNGPFPVQESILGNLTNQQYNAMRATCRSVNDILTERASNLPPGATPRWRNQRYMIVKCDEQNLPIPPTGNSIAPGGTCSNTVDTTTFMKNCDDCSSPYRGHLVCARCRHNNHWNPPTGIPGSLSSHDRWMAAVPPLKARVCTRCDHEQYSEHPQGFEGCTCFDDQYRKIWTCKLDDDRRLRVLSFQKQFRTFLVAGGWQCGHVGRHFIHYWPRHTKPRCLCSRRYLPQSRQKPRETQQCLICFGYVVPAPPRWRRSERVRRAEGTTTSQPSFQMLAVGGRGTTATYRVNRHGFDE